VADFCVANEFSVIPNIGFHPTHVLGRVIDIFLAASETCASGMVCTVLEGSLGSDHRPIWLTVGVPESSDTALIRRRLARFARPLRLASALLFRKKIWVGKNQKTFLNVTTSR
jgi:hypothetical protein